MLTLEERQALGEKFEKNTKRRGNQDLEIVLPGPKTFLADLLGGPRKGDRHLEGHARALLAHNCQ